MQIPEIKSRLPILKVLATYNLKPDKNNLLRCLFHEDKTASLQVYPKTNTFHCFACGATGDQIEFIEKYEKCSKHEALKKATELTKEIKDPDVMGIASKAAACAETDFETLFTRQKESLPRSPKSLQYLKDRGLENLQEVGYNSGINWKKLKQCITFALKDKSGNIVSLYGRGLITWKANGSTATMEYGKHYYSENRKGLYPGYPNPETETLIITEAIIDAATLLQVPEISSQFTILAAYGTNGLTKEHKAAIQALNLKEIIIFFDGDTAGKAAAKSHMRRITKAFTFNYNNQPSKPYKMKM